MLSVSLIETTGYIDILKLNSWVKILSIMTCLNSERSSFNNLSDFTMQSKLRKAIVFIYK